MLQTLTRYCIVAFALSFAVAACTQDGSRARAVAASPRLRPLLHRRGPRPSWPMARANSDNVGDAGVRQGLVRREGHRRDPLHSAPRLILASAGPGPILSRGRRRPLHRQRSRPPRCSPPSAARARSRSPTRGCNTDRGPRPIAAWVESFFSACRAARLILGLSGRAAGAV